MNTAAPTWDRTREWIVPLVLWRLFQLFLVPLAVYLVPFNQAEYDVAFRHRPDAEPTFLDAWATWDAQHYLHLAADGYSAGEMSAAFYPAWPMLLAGFGAAALPAGVLLANALAVGGALLFHRLVVVTRGADTADVATWFLMAAPGAFWLGMPYPESLFLVLVCGYFLAIATDRPGIAGALGFLAALTRPVGVFLVVPLLWVAWERRSTRPAAAAVLPALGYAAYFAVMQVATGDAFAGFEAQKLYIAQPSIGKLFDPVGIARRFVDVRAAHTKLYSALDRALVLFTLGLLPAVWKADRSWFWYTLLAAVIPAITAGFMSFARYQVLLFPLWVVLAELTAPPEHRHLRAVLLGGMLALQHMLLTAHVTWSWAG